MKFRIEVEVLPEREFKLTMEDQVAITHVTTTRPIQEIIQFLKDSGVKGKRGPQKKKEQESAPF